LNAKANDVIQGTVSFFKNTNHHRSLDIHVSFTVNDPDGNQAVKPVQMKWTL
jgi:hypothetical protein